METENRFGPGFLEPEAAPRTSLRLEYGRPCHEDAHRERLRLACAALDANGAWLGKALDRAFQWAQRTAADEPSCALRLVADPTQVTLHARLEAIPDLPSPYLLLPRPHPLNAERLGPLGVHKGCLGPWNRRTLAEVRAQGGADALLVDAEGALVESCIAAVGCLQGRYFVTPPPAGRVRSIAELRDLPRWADERGWDLMSAPISLQEARQGQLWCFNALRGLWPAECHAP